MTKAGTASDEVLWLNMGQWPCYLGFTTTERAFKGVMRRLKVSKEEYGHWINPGSHATVHHLTKGDSASTYVMCIKPQTKEISNEAYAALLAHECVHVLQYIQADYAQGRSLGTESDAYLVQYILQEILQYVWKSNKSKAIKPK